MNRQHMPYIQCDYFSNLYTFLVLKKSAFFNYKLFKINLEVILILLLLFKLFS